MTTTKLDGDEIILAIKDALREAREQHGVAPAALDIPIAQHDAILEALQAKGVFATTVVIEGCRLVPSLVAGGPDGLGH